MSADELPASHHLPAGFTAPRADLAPVPAVLTAPDGERVPFARLPVDADTIAALARHLRARRHAVLVDRPVRSIVDALERVTRRWLDRADPLRRETVERVARATGFSVAMTEHSLDLEFESSRGAHMLRALRSELGDPEMLDGLSADAELGGRRMAVGPALVAGIASANLPGLPHLTVTRALLVKAACLMRSSRAEPFFLPAYARSLAEEDPELGSCVAVLDFDPGPGALETAFLSAADHLIAYGGAAALGELAARLPAGRTATWHGHRMGFSLVTREALAADDAELAARVAYDFSLFDREACLSPQICFVEGDDPARLSAFAHAVDTAMERWARELPPMSLGPGTLAARRQAAELVEMRAAMGEPVELVRAPGAHGWAVVVDPAAALEPAPRGRWARLAPVADATRLPEILEPARAHLQVAALEDPAGRLEDLRRELARLGVSRITRPGLAGRPSMMWRHDGRPCLGDLLRWVDEEERAPA